MPPVMTTQRVSRVPTAAMSAFVAFSPGAVNHARLSRAASSEAPASTKALYRAISIMLASYHWQQSIPLRE